MCLHWPHGRDTGSALGAGGPRQQPSYPAGHRAALRKLAPILPIGCIDHPFAEWHRTWCDSLLDDGSGRRFPGNVTSEVRECQTSAFHPFLTLGASVCFRPIADISAVARNGCDAPISAIQATVAASRKLTVCLGGTKASNGVVAVTPPVTGPGIPPKGVEVWTELLPVR